MNKSILLAMTIAGLALAYSSPAQAQTVNSKAREKVRWFNAPREIQIIDDRPIIKDFREAPSAPSQIQLPPGPQGAPGFGGGGAGAMGGDDGGTLPAGGVPIAPGGGQPAYRTDNGSNPVPLPKSGFGPSNIPARGMGPKGPLPGGFTTNRLAGKLQPWAPTSPNSALMSLSGHKAASRPVASGPAATYSAPGGGYGPSVGTGSSYGGGGASTSVSARMLNKLGGR